VRQIKTLAGKRPVDISVDGVKRNRPALRLGQVRIFVVLRKY
jgi:hypothetical protein